LIGFTLVLLTQISKFLKVTSSKPLQEWVLVQYIFPKGIIFVISIWILKQNLFLFEIQIRFLLLLVLIGLSIQTVSFVFKSYFIKSRLLCTEEPKGALPFVI
jgi:hypothetical protein